MTSGKPPTRRRSAEAREPQASLTSYASPYSSTLEGAVLAALKSAQLPSLGEPASRVGVPGITPQKLATLRRQSHELLSGLRELGLLRVRTVRIRPKGEPDRRFVVEYSIDPAETSAVILRVRPASNAELAPDRPAMLTTQQAADRLNVSRPYVAKLVDAGRFEGVARTQSGHRRIPAAEVDRVLDEMRSSRRSALNEIEELTSDLRAKELEAASVKAKRRWVKSA
jgi:excisionase family DNA binding protein